MLRWRGRDERLMAGAFAAAGGSEYGTTLEDLDQYFLAFAVAARRGR